MLVIPSGYVNLNAQSLGNKAAAINNLHHKQSSPNYGGCWIMTRIGRIVIAATLPNYRVLERYRPRPASDDHVLQANHDGICVFDAINVMIRIYHIGRLKSYHCSFQSCPRVGWTRWSVRVTILPDFGGSGRVSISDLLVFYWLFFGTWIDLNLRILATFGLTDFHRYLIYNNYLINK